MAGNHRGRNEPVDYRYCNYCRKVMEEAFAIQTSNGEFKFVHDRCRIPMHQRLAGKVEQPELELEV